MVLHMVRSFLGVFLNEGHSSMSGLTAYANPWPMEDLWTSGPSLAWPRSPLLLRTRASLYLETESGIFCAHLRLHIQKELQEDATVPLRPRTNFD